MVTKTERMVTANVFIDFFFTVESDLYPFYYDNCPYGYGNDF